MRQRPQDAAPRPPAALVLTTWEHLVAFGFGAGLAPKGPGTLGTLWGLPLFWLLALLPPAAYALITVALFGFGVWVCGRSARLLGLHDTPGIVFDEIVGFLIAAAPLHPTLGLAQSAWWLVAAFALFRFFDIVKPPPIRWLDQRVHGGIGIMLDDLVAAAFAAIILVMLLTLI